MDEIHSTGPTLEQGFINTVNESVAISLEVPCGMRRHSAVMTIDTPACFIPRASPRLTIEQAVLRYNARCGQHVHLSHSPDELGQLTYTLNTNPLVGESPVKWAAQKWRDMLLLAVEKSISDPMVDMMLNLDAQLEDAAANPKALRTRTNPNYEVALVFGTFSGGDLTPHQMATLWPEVMASPRQHGPYLQSIGITLEAEAVPGKQGLYQLVAWVGVF